jgi:hypothetical protein
MRTLFITAALLAAVALPGAALASRTASHSEKKQLRSGATGSKLLPKGVRKGHFKLTKVRISTAGPWAKANVVPTGTYSDPFNPAKGLFKRKHGTWKLVNVGTSGVGCSHPRAPKAVRTDLKLHCG